ncbi:hypothetical protein M8818_006492 [Zalaria obscura]|uniref:Uncharacterized protein n=1 Tax=Zalaria obscura TaxID=2024903 RepID=A0ACC3S5Y1_9PEZI
MFGNGSGLYDREGRAGIYDQSQDTANIKPKHSQSGCRRGGLHGALFFHLAIVQTMHDAWCHGSGSDAKQLRSIFSLSSAIRTFEQFRKDALFHTAWSLLFA